MLGHPAPPDKRRKAKQPVSRDLTLDGDDEDEDEATLDPTQQAYYKSQIAYVFGRAMCDEAHYMKNAFSMSPHVLKELKVRLLVFLIGTLMMAYYVLNPLLINYSPTVACLIRL